MNLSEQIARMIEAGVPAAEAGDIAAQIYAAGVASAAKRSTSAIRQARYRERNKASQTVTALRDDDTSQSVTKRNESVTCDASAILPIDTKIKNSKRRGSDGASRGTRIDPEWSPSAEDRSIASSEGFSASEIERELLRFRDYWLAASGSNAVKRDWSATWRNWIRNGADRAGKRPATAQAASSEIDWDAQCLRFKQGMQWSAKWYGPEPGALGCRVPPDILAKHGLLQSENHDPPPVQLRSMQ